MVNTNADLSDMAVKTAICIYSKVHIFCGINPDSQQIFVISDFQIDTNKNKAYRPNAHLLYIVMQYNGNAI